MAKDTLKKERLQILKLLANGKINAEEAESLLNALETNNETPSGLETPTKKGPFRMIKIAVDSKEDGEKVRVQIPLEFAKFLKKGGKVGSVNLGDYDIDYDALMEMVNSGAIGEIVNVESDQETVKIYVD